MLHSEFSKERIAPLKTSQRIALLLLLCLALAACKPQATPLPAPTAPPAASTPLPTPTAAPPTPTAAPIPMTPPPGAEGLPWWNNTVFYEVFVRSFADSTTGPLANDGIGDLQGLIEKLDYLQSLGVSGLWLMPIMQSPSYHGYDITDYYTVEKDYGTNEDFKRLMVEAHRRGIRVIIDLVLNHTSSQHPWFTDAAQPGSQYRDWYIWANENPGYLGPWGAKAWHLLGSQWYYGVFWEGMPDLNYRTPAVTEEMLKVTRYWLAEMGADGYRLDAIPYLIEKDRLLENTPDTHEWLRDFHKTVRAANPDAFTVGEVWKNTQIIADYVPDQVDTAFMFDLATGIADAINNRMRGPVIVNTETILANFSAGQYATFLTNHDQNRIMTVLGKKADRAKLAATMLLTLPGVPFLYYGEEIGMTGMKPDEKLRTPMQWTAAANAGFSAAAPWQAVNSGYEQVNVETEAADAASLLNHYRKLIALRNEHPALRLGDLTLLDGENRTLVAFLRQSADETLLVVINLDEQPAGDYTFALASSKLTGKLTAVELLNGAEAVPPALNAQGGFADYKPVAELAPRTGYLIRLAP